MKYLNLTAISFLLLGCSSVGRHKNDPLKAQVFYRQGVEFFRNENFGASLRAFMEAEKYDASRDDIALYRIRATFHTGQETQAIDELNRFCDAKKEGVSSCRVWLAKLFYLQKNYQRAKEIWLESEKDPLLPNKENVYAFLSAVHLQQGDNAKALEYINLATSTRSGLSNCSIRMLESRLRLRQAQFVRAVKSAEIALRLCEDKVETHRWLVYAYYKSARFAAAERSLRRALSLFREPSDRSQLEILMSKLKNQEVLDEPELLL